MIEKPLLILDLDETLIRGVNEALDRAPEMVLSHYFIYYRPHVREFLAHCGERYTLGLWSSATSNYIAPIAKALWKDLPPPLFVWDRSRCTVRYDFHKGEEYFVKDLRKVMANGVDLARMIMVDDELRKVSLQNANALCVRPFLGDTDDAELQHLSKYLDSICGAPDFRKVDKTHWHQLSGIF